MSSDKQLRTTVDEVVILGTLGTDVPGPERPVGKKKQRREAKRARKSAKKKAKKVSRPSVVHMAAFLRSGSGRHKDKKKAASKNACRGRVSRW